jgi:hypothetical protein
MVMTWKVWTSEPRPIFEGTEADASGYVVDNLADSRDALLEGVSSRYVLVDAT